MNSSRLFSKTVRSDFRREIPWFVMYSIVFLFFIPVAYLFGLNGVEREYAQFGSAAQTFVYERLYGYTLRMVGISIPGLIGLMCAGFLEAYHEFGFLHRRNEIDFYHGLPQSRRQLFFGRFVNGLKFVLVPYLLTTVIGAVCAVITGVRMQDFAKPFITGLFFSILLFLMVYVLAILAIMLTGRALTGILGMAVLSGYFPFMSLCITGIPSLWFSTYSSQTDRLRILDLISDLSPVTQAIQFAGVYFERFSLPENPEAVTGGFIIRILISIAVIAAGIWLSYVLYKKRPLEKVGEAMIFRPTERVIRILLVAAAAIGVMQFMRAIGSSLGWILFFTFAAVSIGHILVELIYRADAKKVFTHPVELAAMAVLAALLIIALTFDFFGYNRYLPKEGEVASAKIHFDMEYTWPVWNEDSFGEETILWYMDRDGALTAENEIEAVRAIAAVGIEHSADHDSDSPVVLKYQQVSSVERTYPVNVTWTLKNGRSVSRSYTVTLEDMHDAYETLHDLEGYRHYTYPVLDADIENDVIGVVYVVPGGRRQAVEDAWEKEVLDAYLMDVRDMTMKDIEGKQPCALIRFLLSERILNEEYDLPTEAELARRYENVGQAAPERDTGSEAYWLYPVYDSFVRTKNALETAGVSTVPVDAPEKIVYNCSTVDEKGNYRDVTGNLVSAEDRECIWKNLELYPYSAYNMYGPEMLANFGVEFVDEGQNSVYSSVIRTKETEAIAKRCFEENGLEAPDYE